MERENLKGRIDWITTLIPFVIVLAMMLVFMLIPSQSKLFVDTLRGFFGDTIGIYYVILGLGCVLLSLYLAFKDKYGQIKLGNIDKPVYSNFAWGTMIFTSTMAADIMFYSLIEWALYGAEPHVAELGKMQLWAPTFPLFHWGKLIDIVAVFAMVCATATTFSLASPLLASALASVFGISTSVTLTIGILLLICAVYTITVLLGMNGISKLASFCSYMFFAILFYFLFLGGETRYIVETGFQSLGNMVQNFIGLSTYMDPLRENNFPQTWTIYYWAYWLVWCIATPFFIALISKGRTIKNLVFGTFGWGLAGTYMSFIILGNYGLAQQLKHGLDVTGYISNGGEMYQAILKIFGTLPLPEVALILLVITMIAFYSTTLDGITYVASSYSYNKISADEEPSRKIRAVWSIMLILFPIGLLFAENTLYSLQSVTIIAAFPVGILLILIVWSFFKDVKNYLNEK